MAQARHTKHKTQDAPPVGEIGKGTGAPPVGEIGKGTGAPPVGEIGTPRKDAASMPHAEWNHPDSKGTGAPPVGETKTGASAELEALQEEKAALTARIAELEEKCACLAREEKYRMAEFDNYRRRTRQEQEEFRKNAARDLLAELLDIEDGFANARDCWSDNEPAACREGVELIARKFSSILEKYGVKLIEAEGSAFDPAVHEALFAADEGEHEGEIVGQVLQRGYLLNDKVLRLAKVKVLRGLGKAAL